MKLSNIFFHDNPGQQKIPPEKRPVLSPRGGVSDIKDCFLIPASCIFKAVNFVLSQKLPTFACFLKIRLL